MTLSPAQLEQFRRTYRPERIRVLFVGESPPAGGTFFYLANSNLARYTQVAFERAYDQTLGSSEAFLRFFKDTGCYLEDLCDSPVNHLRNTSEDRQKRRQERKKGIPRLADQLHTHQPAAVIVVMKDIEKDVRRAVSNSGLSEVPLVSLPFPGQGNQWRYVDQLSVALRRFREKLLLP